MGDTGWKSDWLSFGHLPFSTPMATVIRLWLLRVVRSESGVQRCGSGWGKVVSCPGVMEALVGSLKLLPTSGIGANISSTHTVVKEWKSR